MSVANSFKTSCNLQFKNVIQHLAKFVEILRGSDGSFRSFKTIEHELETKISALKNSFEDCQTQTQDSLDKTNNDILEEVEKVHENEARMNSMEIQMECLNCSIVSQKASIKDQEEKMQSCKDELQESETILSELRQREEDYTAGARYARNATVGFGLVPFINLVAMPLFAVVWVSYENSKNEVQKRITSAQSEITACKKNIRSASLKLDQMVYAKTKMENERSCFEKEIEKTKQHIKTLRQEQEKHLELQEFLQRSLKLVSEISGKARVLHSETKGGYSIEPLLLPLKELTRKIIILSDEKYFSLTDIDCKMLSRIQCECSKNVGSPDDENSIRGNKISVKTSYTNIGKCLIL